MLYVTTRSDKQTFSAKYVLNQSHGPDGGLFVPLERNGFSRNEVRELLEMSFEQCVAQVLNRLLDLHLTGWDISFCAGRHPVRIRQLGQKIQVAEGWHNPDGIFSRMVSSLMQMIQDKPEIDFCSWSRTAIYTAVLAGLYGELSKTESALSFDLIVPSLDFTASVCAWYLRNWGFPIGNIICCCCEEENLWELFVNGQMRTDGIRRSINTPEADAVVLPGLERLVYGCGGVDETGRYLTACREGRPYIPQDTVLDRMRKGFYISVVGKQRMLETIPRVYASRKYLLSPFDALCYCGLSDYWSKFGRVNPAVIFSERSPGYDLRTVSIAMGISEEELKRMI